MYYPGKFKQKCIIKSDDVRMLDVFKLCIILSDILYFINFLLPG